MELETRNQINITNILRKFQLYEREKMLIKITESVRNYKSIKYLKNFEKFQVSETEKRPLKMLSVLETMNQLKIF